jgi:hypothetical protein
MKDTLEILAIPVEPGEVEPRRLRVQQGFRNGGVTRAKR